MQAEEIIRVKEHYYIIASSPAADIRTFPLKEGAVCGVFDRYGDILPLGQGEQGLYRDCTRFLSRFELRIGSKRALLLSSAVKSDNFLLTVDLANPDIFEGDRVRVPRESIHIFRRKFLWNEACHELIRLDNFTAERVDLSLNFLYDADFADIFEIRGTRRMRKGQRLPTVVGDGSAAFGYVGLDGIRRTTDVAFSPAPASVSEDRAEYDLSLAPGEEFVIFVTVSYRSGPDSDAPSVEGYETAFRNYQDAWCGYHERTAKIMTSNERFNEWLGRSASDLHMMLTGVDGGFYPYAGIPWYCAPFGRDGLLSAFQSLWADPEIARGVLLFLAENQAGDWDDEKDAEPGKIFHEFRQGEMANTGEIPFGQYYGSVDSTPLFILLAGAYHERTGDDAFIERLWPHILRAMDWIDKRGDVDGDGFVEYLRHSSRGLTQQGWKDSWDAVFHADGTLAEGPVALVEVQGYVYAAKIAAAKLARALGHRDLSGTFEKEAARLQAAFEERFWSEEKGMYVIALDGQKRPCRVRSSNAGQVLFTGIAGPQRAGRVVRELMKDDFFTGWGIRTIASTEARYNPMSYHNGSVWPHDNALIGYGMARYGMIDPFMKLFSAIFDASVFMEWGRLPELFCGFKRRTGEGPTLYPVACSPQAWSAAAVYLFLQGCFGLTFDREKNAIVFNHPHLPPFLQWVQIRDLAFRDTKVDILLGRYDGDVVLRLLRKDGAASVVITK